MPNDTTITSLQNPRVKALVKLRDQRGRRKAGLFIAEGQRAVERAAAAGLQIESLWVCETLLGVDPASMSAPVTAASGIDAGLEVVHVSEAVFKKIAYVREPEGILAVCVAPHWSAESVSAADASALQLVAVGTEKPGNLGAMVRTAELAGCHSVVAAGTPVDAMNPNAIRASTGAVFTLPTVSLDEADAIDYLKAQNTRIIAAVVDGEVGHTQADYTGSCAVVIGPEDKGLSEAWHTAAEQTGGQRVRIETAGRSADSLNASVAAGVLLFEAVRQRHAAGLQ